MESTATTDSETNLSCDGAPLLPISAVGLRPPEEPQYAIALRVIILELSLRASALRFETLQRPYSSIVLCPAVSLSELLSPNCYPPSPSSKILQNPYADPKPRDDTQRHERNILQQILVISKLRNNIKQRLHNSGEGQCLVHTSSCSLQFQRYLATQTQRNDLRFFNERRKVGNLSTLHSRAHATSFTFLRASLVKFESSQRYSTASERYTLRYLLAPSAHLPKTPIFVFLPPTPPL